MRKNASNSSGTIAARAEAIERMVDQALTLAD
jgi:hypothetical protein